MTRKRYLAVAGLLAILVGAGLGVAMMLPAVPGVTKANFDQIENGMSKGDVQAIFGLPPFIDSLHAPIPDPAIWQVWRAADGSEASVRFVDDRVALKIWRNSDETILKKLRRWLHL